MCATSSNGSINVTVRGSGCVRWVRTASGALSLRASASTHGSKRASMAFRSDAAQRSRTSHACCMLHCMLHAVCCTLHDREVRSQPGALHEAATACPWRTHRAQAGGIPNQSDLVRVLTSTRPPVLGTVLSTDGYTKLDHSSAVLEHRAAASTARGVPWLVLTSTPTAYRRPMAAS